MYALLGDQKREKGDEQVIGTKDDFKWLVTAVIRRGTMMMMVESASVFGEHKLTPAQQQQETGTGRDRWRDRCSQGIARMGIGRNEISRNVSHVNKRISRLFPLDHIIALPFRITFSFIVALLLLLALNRQHLCSLNYCWPAVSANIATTSDISRLCLTQAKKVSPARLQSSLHALHSLL